MEDYREQAGIFFQRRVVVRRLSTFLRAKISEPDWTDAQVANQGIFSFLHGQKRYSLSNANHCTDYRV
ncbi:MAG: hypothetical protein ACLRSW_16405 [Christensenellaceae bacterium]